MRFDCISVVGLGLLGGSLALAAKERKLANRVHAYARRAETVAEARARHAADLATTNLKEAVQGADLVVLCTPLSQMGELASQMRLFLRSGAIVTDVGSVKAPVVAELEPLLRSAKVEFVGSHPMAGSERTGLTASRADLFDQAVCLVTPSAGVSPSAISAVEQFWRDLGACPLRMSPETHDDLVSRSSHLPHVVAAELANYVLSPVHPKEQAMVCGPGFRDTTRIASGSPEMWRDIALANRKNLARVLGVFIEDLQEFQFVLERGDAKAIEEFFANAKQRRDQWRSASESRATE